MKEINVKSEIAPLKKVLLHRPGKELLNLTPDTLGRLLFDDIPFLPDAIKEHEEFSKILTDKDKQYWDEILAWDKFKFINSYEDSIKVASRKNEVKIIVSY